MVLEDFTTYTEVDEGDAYLTVIASKVTFTQLPRTVDCYVYKDFDAGHFHNFTHDFDFRITGESNIGSGAQGVVDLWHLGDDLDDIGGLIAANKTFIGINCYADNTKVNNRCRLIECDAGTVYWKYNGFIFAMNTTYYVRAVKSGTSFVAGFYSSAALRNAGDGTDGDVANLSLTLQHDYTFRYVGVSWSWDDAITAWISGYAENLDLHEVVVVKGKPASIIPLMKGMDLISAVKPFSKRFPKFKPRLVA